MRVEVRQRSGASGHAARCHILRPSLAAGCVAAPAVPLGLCRFHISTTAATPAHGRPGHAQSAAAGGVQRPERGHCLHDAPAGQHPAGAHACVGQGSMQLMPAAMCPSGHLIFGCRTRGGVLRRGSRPSPTPSRACPPPPAWWTWGAARAAWSRTCRREASRCVRPLDPAAGCGGAAAQQRSGPPVVAHSLHAGHPGGRPGRAHARGAQARAGGRRHQRGQRPRCVWRAPPCSPGRARQAGGRVANRSR